MGDITRYKFELKKGCLLEPREVNFSDIIGNRESAEIIQRHLAKMDRNTIAAGDAAQPGLLLYGPPGTGKTMFAKACAWEAKLPFLNVRSTDLITAYTGVNKMKVRALFSLAKELADESGGSCIIFMDEIECIGKLYTGPNESPINELRLDIAAEMKQSESKVFFLGATNFLDDIDKDFLAIFERIYVDVPLSNKDKEGFLRNRLIKSDNDIAITHLKHLNYKTAPTGSGSKKLYKSGDIADLWVNQASILNISEATSFYQQAGMDDEMIIQPDMCVVEYDPAMFEGTTPSKINIKMIDASWAAHYFMPKKLTLLDLLKTDIGGLGASVDQTQRDQKEQEEYED